MKARLQRIERRGPRVGECEALVGRDATERIGGLAAGLRGHRLLYVATAPGESTRAAA